MYRIILLIIMTLSVLLPFTAAASGTVPKAASSVVKQLDKQLQTHIGSYARGRVTIAMTVPASLNDLHRTSPLARQMAEEIGNQLVDAGYALEEIRKGYDIQMQEGVGELILTRQLNHLASRDVTAEIIVTGTYTITRESVRFNIRMLHTPSNRVLASSSATVPVTTELYPLVADRRTGGGPSVRTRLN